MKLSTSTDNALSADNQQATSIRGESPQRLYAKYPIDTEIDEQEATLLGILFTDGCLSKKKGGGWRFYLGNTSFEIIQAFRQCMTSVFGLESQRVRISQTMSNGKPYYKAKVDSAQFGSFLTAKYGTFRTLAFTDKEGLKVFPSTHLPFTASSKKRIVSKFLKAAFSCDGGVNLYVARQKNGYTFLIRNVYLACKHPQLQQEYKEALSLLGIQSKIIDKDNKILVQRRAELQKFRDKIAFLDGVKITQHSAFWAGWEKNEVLNLALASYGQPKTIFTLPQFHSSL